MLLVKRVYPPLAVLLCLFAVPLTVILAQSTTYQETFEAYSVGADPLNWLDTDFNNSLTPNETLFKVFEVNSQPVFGTDSTAKNIHSHYTGPGSSAWHGYRYRGRMWLSDTNGSIGATFFSSYPNQGNYYLLRSHQGDTFQLLGIGGNISGGVTHDTGVAISTATWYWFEIEVADTGSRTDIKAKVWAEGNTEPTSWQAEAYDDSLTRLTAGTVGVWSHRDGTKYWDDFSVEPMAAPGQYSLTMNVVGSGSVSRNPARSSYEPDTIVTLTAIPVTGWQFAGWSGDLTGDSNPSPVTMDAAKSITATFVEGTVSGPVINIWYGDSQRFGHLGHPQIWVNILGNIASPPPEDMASLVYALNDGPTIPLTIGSFRRLARNGDFNVDIHYTDLLPTNTLVITATDTVGNQTTKTVTLQYESGRTWPLPYSIDWQAADKIQDVAQVVDGYWTLDKGLLRIVEAGYDRLVALGDTTWADYEATVPIILHTKPDTTGVGLLYRWKGHTDEPVVCDQPKCGWEPLGALAWIKANPDQITFSKTNLVKPMSFDLETPYWFKLRAETVLSDTLYSVKVWPNGQAEPTDWDLTHVETRPDFSTNGSLLLVAHKAEASFGNVFVKPITTSTRYTLTTTTIGSGTVSHTPIAGTYNEGAALVLTAAADEGWHFSHWSHGAFSQANPTSIILNESKLVTATFVEDGTGGYVYIPLVMK